MRHDGGMSDDADLAVVAPRGDDPYFGENHALWLWDQEHQVGMHLYLKTLGHLGKYGLRRETVNVHLPDGTALMVDGDGPGPTDPRKPKGPNLELECIAPFERWSFRYDATAQPSSAPQMREGLLRHMPLVPLEFEVEATMAADPLLSGTMSEGESMEWARQFFGGSRYEQLLSATGTIRTKDGEFPISGGGMRTHRVGSRNTGTFPGHSWLTGTFPSGRGFCVQRFCGADGVAKWEEAFVEEDGKRHRAQASQLPLFSGALPGEELPLVLESALGTTEIHGTLRATNFVTNMKADPFRFCWGIDTSVEDNRIMSQGLATYRWGDEEGAGMIERSVRVYEMPALP